MSDAESLDYLQEGFDPSSLTIPRLRSILVSHNIAYPASAKKATLIDIFNDNVLPQARKLLAARARAKRSSRGIVDMPSSQEGSVTDEEAMPPPPTPRAKSTRKTVVRASVEDGSEETPRSRSPVKRTPRPSTKHPRAEDTETAVEADHVRKTVRKTTRKSTAPDVKVEESDDGAITVASKPKLDRSAFSEDNPFQSGSSPLGPSPSDAPRRKTLGASSSSTKDAPRRKSESRRRTDYVQAAADKGIKPPSRTTFSIPVSQLDGLSSVDDNGVEASEEFTPDAQLELAQERSAKGHNALGPRRPKAKQGGTNKTGPVWVIMLALLGGYATWYRQEKLAVGYCGVGRPSNSLQLVHSQVSLPDWATVLGEPSCEPCPQHAYCYEKLETRCEPDFVMKAHPLALGGLVPLPPTCEPDGEKVRRVKAVADRAVEELHERRAKWECGDLVDEKGGAVPAVEIAEAELKKEVGAKRRKGMGESEFEELWVAALGEIKGREEVESGLDG